MFGERIFFSSSVLSVEIGLESISAIVRRRLWPFKKNENELVYASIYHQIAYAHPIRQIE